MQDTDPYDFGQIVDTIPGFVCTMSPAGEVEFVNQRILDFMGMTLDEVHRWRFTLHEDDCERVVREWNRAVETGLPYDIEHRIRRADGAYRWFDSRSAALLDDGGRILR